MKRVVRQQLLCPPHISTGAHWTFALLSPCPLIRGRGIHDALSWLLPHTSEKPMTSRMCSAFLQLKIYCVNRSSAHLQPKRRSTIYTLSIWRSTFGQMYHGNHSFSLNAILLLLQKIKTMNCVISFKLFLSFFLFYYYSGSLYVSF